MTGTPPPRASLGATPRVAWRVTLLYAALTALLAYPLTLHPASMLMMDAPDTHLFMWTLGWDAHAFLHQPLSIFDANIYFPQRLTLAYSENLIGSAFIAAPVLWLTGNPVLALNVVVLLSCVACGLGAYLLARRVGLDPIAAALCGLVFAFSPARFFRATQLHLATVQWVPFTLAYLHAYLDGRRPRDLRLAAAFFSLQALTSGHGASFDTLAVLLLLGYRLALGEPVALLRRLRDLGVTGVLLLLPAALIYLPYRMVESDLGLARSLEDWTPHPESYIASPTTLHAWLLSLLPGPPVNETANAFLFPGYVPLLLVAVALCWPTRRPGNDVTSGPGRALVRAGFVLEVTALAALASAIALGLLGPMKWRIGDMHVSAGGPLRAWVIAGVAAALRIGLAQRVPFSPLARVQRRVTALRRWVWSHRHDRWRFYGLLTVVCVWLSAGTPLGLWSWVNGLPGLSLIRVPSRFMILGVLGIAVLAGHGFERLTAGAAITTRRAAAAVLGLAMVIEFAGIPLQLAEFHVTAPAVERWLNQQPKPFGVAEIPVGTKARFQTTYMLHSMTHWQKTIHGYSGVQAPLHDQLFEQLKSFPDEPGLRRLEELGVNYLVVHPDLYSRSEWAEVEALLPKFSDRLVLVHEEDGGRVYSLPRARAGR